MTLKEILEKTKNDNSGYVQRKSAEKYDYIVIDEHNSVLDNNGFLKPLTEEEIKATDWEIKRWDNLNV